MDKKEVVQGFYAVWAYISSLKISFIEKFFVIGFVLVYIVSPVDLIPDIPVIGWLDDIGIGALFIAFCNYRINSLNTKDTEKDFIDATPKDKTSVESDNQFSSSPKSTFAFTQRKNVSDNTNSGTK